ncbi:MAG: MerR family transcriptional regulator [Ignavibacteriales bacterium]
MMPNENGLMKISELAAAAGVTKQTIHYYLREGLLLPPAQSSKNMAYYDSRHLEEIRLIKELQENKFYPLSVIKLILDGRRSGHDMDSTDHLETMDMLFNKTHGDMGAHNRNAEINLPADVISKLESLGLITSPVTKEGMQLDEYDAAITEAIGQLLDLGLEYEDLNIFREFLNLIRREAGIIHDRIIRSNHREHPPLKDINSALSNARMLLIAKAYREYLIQHRHPGEEGGDHNA